MGNLRTATLPNRGYSLVEMLAVVVILGVLAALVTYAAHWIVARARIAAFQANARTFINAAEIYRFREGHYPVSPAPGELPPRWENYVDPDDWFAATPLGGQWHIGGDPVGLGILQNYTVDESTGEISESDQVLQASVVTDLEYYDEIVDDANLTTGSFAAAGDGFFRHIFGW